MSIGRPENFPRDFNIEHHFFILSQKLDELSLGKNRMATDGRGMEMIVKRTFGLFLAKNNNENSIFNFSLLKS